VHHEQLVHVAALPQRGVGPAQEVGTSVEQDLDPLAPLFRGVCRGGYQVLFVGPLLEVAQGPLPDPVRHATKC